MKRYEQRIEQFKQNRIFDLDQKKIYTELNGIRSNDVPNAEECTKFWGDIWGVRTELNREAEWLKDMKRQRVNDESKCLPLMWRLLTGVIAEEMYNYLEREKILPENKKDAKEEVVEQRIRY